MRKTNRLKLKNADDTSPESIKERLERKKKSPEQWLAEQTLFPLEEERLGKVFNYISSKDKGKIIKAKSELKLLDDSKEPDIESKQQEKQDAEFKEKVSRITEGDLKKLFEDMKIDVKISEIKDMIWEVDEDMDMSINYQEFVNMYKRCVNDHDYLEPRKLFNLVQFLMFDKDFKGNIIEEQTLDLLIIRYGREDLDEQLEGIFGNEKTYGDQEMSISYKDYIEKVDKMALQHHIEMRKAREEKSTSRIPSRK